MTSNVVPLPLGHLLKVPCPGKSTSLVNFGYKAELSGTEERLSEGESRLSQHYLQGDEVEHVTKRRLWCGWPGMTVLTGAGHCGLAVVLCLDFSLHHPS